MGRPIRVNSQRSHLLNILVSTPHSLVSIHHNHLFNILVSILHNHLFRDRDTIAPHKSREHMKARLSHNQCCTTVVRVRLVLRDKVPRVCLLRGPHRVVITMVLFTTSPRPMTRTCTVFSGNSRRRRDRSMTVIENCSVEKNMEKD